MDYRDFLAKVKDRTIKPTDSGKVERADLKALFSQYENLVKECPLSDKKVEEGVDLLLQIFSKGHMDRKALQIGINTLMRD